MKARIVRMIDKSMHKDPTCLVCGEAKRKNKSLFEVKLPCNHLAEVRICRTCSGEEGNMREDSIELPYLTSAHYHVENRQGKTFWDLTDTLNWIKEYMQLPEPQPEREGVYVIKLPFTSIRFFKCDGSNKQDKADYDQLSKILSDVKADI